MSNGIGDWIHPVVNDSIGDWIHPVADTVSSVASHLVFVWRPSGYELREREGEPPALGEEVEEDGARMEVVKVAASPLPDDDRRAAYLMPV